MNLKQLSKALNENPDNAKIVRLIQKCNTTSVCSEFTIMIVAFMIIMVFFNLEKGQEVYFIAGVFALVAFYIGYYYNFISDVNTKLKYLYNFNTLKLIPINSPRNLKKQFFELNQGNYKNTIHDVYLADNVIIGKYTFVDKHVDYVTEYNKHNKPIQKKRVYYETYYTSFMLLKKKRNFQLWVQSRLIGNNGQYSWTSSLKKFNDIFTVHTNNIIETAKFLTPQKIIKISELPIFNIEIINDNTLVTCEKELLSMSNTQDIDIKNKQKTISVFRDNKGKNNSNELKELFLQD